MLQSPEPGLPIIRAVAATPSKSSTKTAPDDEAIHRVISGALLAGRLAPGAPLREVALAEVFGVSRERIRKVLQRLGTERLLVLQPRRLCRRAHARTRA
jgi:DNA-binding GntR family transcriptional regulator